MVLIPRPQQVYQPFSLLCRKPQLIDIQLKLRGDVHIVNSRVFYLFIVLHIPRLLDPQRDVIHAHSVLQINLLPRLQLVVKRVLLPRLHEFRHIVVLHLLRLRLK